MDAGFLATWDTWLSEGLLQLRRQQPEAWLSAYLASPSWRFLLMPGAMPGVPGISGTCVWKSTSHFSTLRLAIVAFCRLAMPSSEDTACEVPRVLLALPWP